MTFYADLHIHSKFSRATSRESDLEHLAAWAARKGLAVVGTGDFTHPAWLNELKTKLVSAEPGLFRLRPELWSEAARVLPPSCRIEPRFLLAVEISTIYKKGPATRKVHHLILVPDLDAAGRLTRALARIGNLGSDGRPILGLDSRDLLEIVLESGPASYLIPAHIWTPWFSVLGSKSGFDSIAECYADLTPHVFALETGLSSDPPMNWRLSGLDRFRLVSNSDAHSPSKLGREACVFATDLSYFAIRRALETGAGYGGTIEFFPEEGKYHLDGHRNCGTRLSPAETRRHDGRCPVCGKPVTVGVMSRVEALADRPEDARPPCAGPFTSLVPLAEVIAEIAETGPASKTVDKALAALVAKLGPELVILAEAPLEDVARAGSPVIAEAIRRMRAGQVIRAAGYDGEYGVIRLFAADEKKAGASVGLLFELPENEQAPRLEDEKRAAPKRKKGTKSEKPAKPTAKSEPAATGKIEGLDPEQAAAAETLSGPVLIIAGPGTGKTRTLTHRIARLIAAGARPEQCLAITFTRRAAQEMKERLAALLPGSAAAIPVMTFHALGRLVLEEQARAIDRPRPFRVAMETERLALLLASGHTAKRAAWWLQEISAHKRRDSRPAPDSELAAVFSDYEEKMRARGLVDFDDLLALPVALLESSPRLAAFYRERWPHLSIDEYQDLDELQHRLCRLLAPPGSLCAIGDPDQAIYGFRGADPSFFLRFPEDFPEARVFRLVRIYRSTPAILEASLQVIAGAALSRERRLETSRVDPSRIEIHEAQSDKAEAEFVVQTLERLLGGHSFFSIDSGRADVAAAPDYTFSDFAVLYRTDREVAPLLEALGRSGLPFSKRGHRRLTDHPGVAALLEAMRDLPASLPLSERLRAARKKIPASETAQEVEAGLELLTPLALMSGNDYHRFLSEAALAGESDDLDPRAERISLLTLHAAKGLEFRVVFLVACEDGILPLKWGQEAADREEERRLFYVGMTRAKERLFLSHARRRLRQGQPAPAQVSPFLAEIAERLLERSRAETRKGPRPGAEQLDLF